MLVILASVRLRKSKSKTVKTFDGYIWYSKLLNFKKREDYGNYRTNHSVESSLHPNCNNCLKDLECIKR